MSERFRYLQLKSTSKIRLLRLGKDVEARGTIIHTELAEAPEFAGLSYSWGRGVYTSELHLANDRTLLISPTVLQAISRIKALGRYEYLWIDQICIIQADLEERGHQVSLMADIYTTASHVFVWLGPDDQGLAPKLTRMIDLFVPPAPPDRHICISRMDCSDLLRTQAGRSHLGASPPLNTPELTTMSAVLFTPWFIRAWVVQEVALARSVTLLLGALSIPLPTFSYLVSLTALTDRETGGRLRYTPGFECFHRTLHQREQYPTPNLEPLLPFLSRLAGLTLATDPRDLIHAFTGLYKHPHGLLLTPDYTLPVEATYQLAAKAIVATTGTLSIFSAVNGPSPSWSPDWRHPLPARPFRNGPTTPRFDACRGRPHVTNPNETLDKLTVRGRIIASIAHVLAPLNSESHDNVYKQLPLDEIYTSLRGVRHRASAPLTYERILRVILADGSGRREFAATVEPEKQRLTGARVREFVEAWEAKGMDLGYENTAKKIEDDARVLSGHLRVTEGRVLVASEGVKELGLAVKGTEAGYVVCILDGARMPIVVTEVEQEWSVVCEAFWEGAMYGDTDGGKGRDFVLV